MGFPHIVMRSKTITFNTKFLFLAIFLAFLLLFILRSNLSSSLQKQSILSQDPSRKTKVEQVQTNPTTTAAAAMAECQPSPTSACTKIPSSLAQALIHYATSNITPQQTFKEISVTSQVLERRSPCNFLVFGLGHDSMMWAALNHGGRTVFLEENKAWIDKITSKFPSLESYHVVYDSKVRQADELMQVGLKDTCTAVGDTRLSKCELAVKGVASEILKVEWEVIMVDAPTGYFLDAPGRMGAIYTAGMMARNRKEGETDVFVHDVDRTVEDKFSKTFLCQEYMRRQEGRLRHFTIPSHRGNLGKPFCP